MNCPFCYSIRQAITKGYIFDPEIGVILHKKRIYISVYPSAVPCSIGSRYGPVSRLCRRPPPVNQITAYIEQAIQKMRGKLIGMYLASPHLTSSTDFKIPSFVGKRIGD